MARQEGHKEAIVLLSVSKMHTTAAFYSKNAAVVVVEGLPVI